MEKETEQIFSDIIYSVCKSVSEISGRSGMAYISMVGKNLLKLVEEKEAIQETSEDPIRSLNEFLKFFVDVGYADNLEARMENDALYISFENIRFYESEKLLFRDKSDVMPLYVTFAARAFLEKYYDLSLVFSSYERMKSWHTTGCLKIL